MKIQIYLQIALLVLLFFSCSSKKALEVENIALIPVPQKLTTKAGTFSLDAKTSLSLPEGEDWQKVATYLNQKLEKATGSSLNIVEDGAIQIIQDAALGGSEAYQLSVGLDQIQIKASAAQGAFYAIQSLLQLMPSQVFSAEQKLDLAFNIPSVEIEDAPTYGYRGMMLDVGRHFYKVEEIKEFIDVMALHKFNRFHWHLTEDQGWRIEIKQYPKLTEIGAYRAQTLDGHLNDTPLKYDGKRYGGFYTQAQVKDIVQYAADRFITIIPEIELPGHAQAAIAAYPELGCLGEQLKVKEEWGVSKNIYCPTEETFTFLENVIDEVAALFPSEYFHIGGDECPKDQWKESGFAQNLMKKEGLKNEAELQSYFIRRAAQILNERGKRLIGWDEILEGGLAPNATVMSWRGEAGGIEAANEGHDVIMSPTSNCYLDYYNSLHPNEPLAIGGNLPLKTVYEYDPIPEEIAADKRQHILGAQANVWTEYIANKDYLFYMSYPRAAALAELTWSGKEKKDYADFLSRLQTQFGRYEAMGIKAAESAFTPEGQLTQGLPKGKLLSFDQEIKNGEIYYTLDGSQPSLESNKYEEPVNLEASSNIKAALFIDGQQRGWAWNQRFNLHKALNATMLLSATPAERYSKEGPGVIINGVRGSDKSFSGDNEWLGFEGKDVDVALDLKDREEISSVSIRFFENKGSWIHFPSEIKLFTSENGKDFKPVGVEDAVDPNTRTAQFRFPESIQTRYLKIAVQRHGIIEEGLPGAGYEAWLFLGEIEVE